jgi:hypothetical protein
MFDLQCWHIDNEDNLVLGPGTSDLDMARGYFDPDQNEVVITLEAMKPATRKLDAYVHQIVVAMLAEQWPNARIRREAV